jgi:hypothetical protein
VDLAALHEWSSLLGQRARVQHLWALAGTRLGGSIGAERRQPIGSAHVGNEDPQQDPYDDGSSDTPFGGMVVAL